MATVTRRKVSHKALARLAQELKAALATRWDEARVRQMADYVGVLHLGVLGGPVPLFDMGTVWGKDEAEDERLIHEADFALVAAGATQFVRRSRTRWEKEHLGCLVLVTKSGRGSLLIGSVLLS